MDHDLKNKLIVIAAITSSIVAVYFLISPYQNCVRSWPGKFVDPKGNRSYNQDLNWTVRKEQYCRDKTSW